MPDTIFLQELRTRCRIGIFDWERKIKQTVLLNLEFPASIQRAAASDKIEHTTDYKKIAKGTLAFVSQSQFYLLETLAERLAAWLLREFRLPWIRLELQKPGAIRGAKTVGVRILRRKNKTRSS